MRGTRGLSLAGSLIAGAVTLGLPATPRIAFAIPEPPSAHPFLGHLGGPVDRPLSGRITLANPTGEKLAFRVTDPTLLPAGITLDADGLLGGASRVPGTWTVPIEACVPSGGCVTGTVTITVTCRCAHPSPPSPQPVNPAAPNSQRRGPAA